MASRFRVAVPADFELNKPLDFPLYDDNGNLLLRRGYVISMPSLVERLLSRRCYVGPADCTDQRIDLEDESGSPAPAGADRRTGSEEKPQVARPVTQAPVYVRTADMTTSIRRIHKLLCEPPSTHMNVVDYIRDRAKLLISLVDEDADAVLAAAYLSPEPQDYRPGQQLLGAALAALLAPQCGFDPEKRVTLVCAAMTRDVGLADFDKVSGTYGQTLNDTARSLIRKHVNASCEILKSHGVDDADWLRMVREHHERPDGEGYPDNKRAGEIAKGALLLNLTDSYASMVLQSDYSVSKFPANAMKELFLEKELRYDATLVALLFKNLTRFPAGTLVTLSNGEIGVIKKTPQGKNEPVVHSLYDRTGAPRSAPVVRDTNLPEFAITGCVSPARCKSATLIIRRLWQTAS